MPVVRDQIGREVTLINPAQRIVSLVPSITEYLHSLQLNAEVVGLTKFCIHPDVWYRSKTRVGGTKTPALAAIQDLRPDLIIANKEENRKEDIEVLSGYCAVYVSDINTLNDALQMMKDIGLLVGRQARAEDIVKRVKEGFASMPFGKWGTAAYMIWQDPWMSVGSRNFIHDMLTHGGWENAFSDVDRYPQIGIEDIIQRSPDFVFLSSEPYPFKEMHRAELQKVLPHSRVYVVDGEMFSWYGSRLLAFPEYIRKLHLELT
ncbi:MAG: ABC transporter substrate-binding protein [Flavobacteriales bacterium]|nr:ABC transporter substrate-binding protein [Flavobacteriales bacterium]